MTYIETVPEDAATGDIGAQYAADRDAFGYVRNLTAAYSLAPEVLAAWQQLNAAIKGRMDLRRYELVTIAAARRLRSSYCALAHGSVLLEQFVDGLSLQAIMSDHHTAGLDEVDVAVMDLADKVAVDGTSVTKEDVDGLRALGLTDSEIFDVVAAASARCFFSTTLDALGVQPDQQYEDLDSDVRSVLTVGRPIAAG
jgi:uncharacterized peroxidase-related enzyme